jgi:hypothetical protein
MNLLTWSSQIKRNVCERGLFWLCRMAVFLLVFAVFSGCSVRRLVVWQVADLMEGGFPAFMKETDPALMADAMPANLKMIEAFLENDPQNSALLLLACQGYAAYAYLFIEEDDPVRAIAFYERAKSYGFALLHDAHLVPTELYSLDAWDDRLASARKKDVPAIFWTAFAWGGRIQLDRESPASLADMPFVIRLAQQAEALDPSYWFSGPDTFLGFYHGSMPVPLGGRPEISKAHFEAALELTGRRFVLIQLLYARSYAVQVQDRALFKALLNEVIQSDDSLLPEAALSNAVAREKAVRLLEKTDEFFQ